ncbi:MAG: transposase zinc-binding domain-containing protein [Proteobacteria bacterium]|nr:transposase zinc-binding domain-containing protein [Pseudomonadota bacterium]MBU4298136.1 transposase zinc-binding domain-containing protein [Pseudomonadota bacterium]
MHWSDGAAVYHPRKPEESPLWRLLHEHFTSFVLEYKARFQRDYGFFRQVIFDVVQNFLKCGDLKQGFARVRCPECHYEYLLAFSCRGRWFCPSCHAKIVVAVQRAVERRNPLSRSPSAVCLQYSHYSTPFLQVR